MSEGPSVRPYIHTYLPTYLRTYVHTYIRTYVHTYIHAYHSLASYVAHLGPRIPRIPPSAYDVFHIICHGSYIVNHLSLFVDYN